MKKLVLIAMASTAAAFGVHAQGSLGNIQTTFSSDGITFDVGNANPSNATNYFTGNVDIEVLYSASATAGTVTALNALDGTSGGSTALTVAQNNDGFVNVLASPTDTSLTAGFIQFAVNGGDFTGADPNTIGLESPVPTGGSGVLALYAVAVGGPEAGWSGLIAWTQSNLGGNLNGSPAGTAAIIHQDPSGDNLDMVAPAASPEPATLAFAGLGGLSVLLFRRRK